MMAVESSFSQDLVRKNKEGSEPKKKLKKTRSIRLSKVPSLKPSSRRSKSRFSWISVDLSGDDTSSANGSSDSSSNYTKATSCSDAKKDKYQGGNETDDAISVGSSSYESLVIGRPGLNQATRIKKMLKNSGTSRSFRRRAISKSVQSSADGSPNYLKATSSSEWRKVHPQGSPLYSESSFNSNDQSNAHSSKSMSVSSSQKSLQSLARTPSMRSVKIVINRNSFKHQRPSLKCTQVSEDLKVDKATCSSTLKDLKFREHVELHDGRTEAERISKMKVCPYHRCSLNGRSHDPAPPPKRPLYKKGRSLKSQKSTKYVSDSTSGVKFSGGKKKEFHISQMKSKVESSSEDGGISITILTPAENDNDMGFSIEIYTKSRAQFFIKAGGESKDAAVVKVFPGESSYHEESPQESVNQMMSSAPQMQDITETTYDLKGRSMGCCCYETEEHKLTLVSAEVGSAEVTASSIGERDQDSPKSGNADLSLVYAPDLYMKHTDQVRTSSDNHANFIRESGEGEPSTLTENSDNFDEATENNSMSSSALKHNLLEDLKTTTGEKNSNSDPDKTFVTGHNQVEDSEKQFMLARDSESSAPREKRISMWHMIHQHMVSGIAGEPEMKPLHREDEEKQVEDINRLPAATITGTTGSDSNMGAEIHDTINQDIELRKVLAVKLVREAIEKILLPEVPDQSSDDQSVISDTISDQDHSESNSYEECAEDSQRECVKRKKEDIADADAEELSHANNIHGIEKVKSETKLENKSDKKAPKHWSNLKKWILLQRFIKALEKVKQFNPKKPRHLQLEPDPNAEKASLRHQTVEERKRAEEWMLDYALRQAVSQLAPAQKKKVALLVNAFETVKSPQENSGAHLTFPRLKEASDKSPCRTKIKDESFSPGENKIRETKEIFASRPDYQERNSITDNEATTPNVPMVAYSQLGNSVCLKPDDIMYASPEKLPGDENPQQDTWEETISNLKTNAPRESISKIEKSEDLSRDLGVSTEIISSVSENFSSKNPITSREEMKKQAEGEHVNLLEIHEDTRSSHNSDFGNGGLGSSINKIELDAVYGNANELSVESKLVTQAGEIKSITTKSAISLTSYTDKIVQQQTAEKEKHRESRPEAVVLKGFMGSKSNDNDSEEDKKNYIRMWHTVYQHVVSSIADKVGSKLLEETDDEEAEDDNKLPEFSKKNQDAGDDNSATPCKGGFSKSDAVKLVQEAVDEILLPEIQDDSSETQSVTSDIAQDEEISENNQIEGGEQNTLNSPELIKDDLREKGSRVDKINSQEGKKAEPLVRNRSEPPKPKNWSKLKKLILLKRSIRALETARKLKSHPRKDLPLMADPEPEKVDLRPLMLDERNKAEQWMLDYTVQHIVNKLTPARKRRVAMLVEAFEAVVPLPEM